LPTRHPTSKSLLSTLSAAWLRCGPWQATALVLFGTLTTQTGCSSADAQRKANTEKADTHHKLAEGYYASRNIDLAIREVLAALELDPTHGDSRYLYGLILFGRMQYEEAAEHFKKALQAKPKLFAARNQLGVTYIELERFHDAVVVLEVLLKEPTYTTPYLTHNNLGLAWWKLKDLRQAEKHFRMAIFLNPKLCNGHRNLGLVAMEQRDYSQAVEHLAEAVQRCPQYAELHLQHGEALEANRRYEDARQAYARCLKLAGETAMGRRCRTRLGPVRDEDANRDDGGRDPRGGDDERAP